MKLGYFTFPIHPSDKNYFQCLMEDRQSVILADKLGFTEAFIGEHLTDSCEKITSCANFISSLIFDTKKIKLATGTLNLPNSHPASIAGQVAMLDNMLKGRFIMGIGPGSLTSDMEVFDTLNKNRTEMFLESIQHIFDIWNTDGPLDLKGKYWNISTKNTFDENLNIGVLPKPYQNPHPEIVVTSLGSSQKALESALNRGWNVLSSNFLNNERLLEQNKIITENQRNDVHWRVAKFIYVSQKKSELESYGLSEKSPIFFCFKQIFNKLKKANRLDIFKKNIDDKNEKIDFYKILSEISIVGSVEEVTDKILELKQNLSMMKTLTYVNVDWKNDILSKKSMELLAEKVTKNIS
jgi:alkanesulfonate monooxygenase SsuD/methylene tetrahydromethanopterin reductase-like flavin-dependent oxidoreductase (luciferase family)